MHCFHAEQPAEQQRPMYQSMRTSMAPGSSGAFDHSDNTTHTGYLRQWQYNAAL